MNDASGNSVAATYKSPGWPAKSGMRDWSLQTHPPPRVGLDVSSLPPQFLRGVDVHGGVVVVKVQHDRQRDGRLGRRQHDHEQGEHLPLYLEGRVVAGER